MNSSEIAKLAGVSRSTVSRVVNGYANVPPKTKERIEQIIKEHGYTPNNAARNLAGKPSKIIGLFIVEQGAQNTNIIHSSPFYSEFMVYITDQLRRKGYHLLVSLIGGEENMNAVKNTFSQKIISGGIFMGDIVQDEILRWLSQNGHYALLINQREQSEFERVLILNTENYYGAYNAVKVLIRFGHRRIAHITGAMEKASAKERMRGYCDALAGHGLRCNKKWVIQADMHREESGYNAAKELFSKIKGELPSAVFCTNDLMAFGAIRALTELGFKVPQDVSVLGFDNVETSKYTTPALSTVETSVEKLAHIASEKLIHSIEAKEINPPPLKMTEFEIIMRDSVAEYEERANSSTLANDKREGESR